MTLFEHILGVLGMLYCVGVFCGIVLVTLMVYACIVDESRADAHIDGIGTGR